MAANIKQSTIDNFRPQKANRNRHKMRGMGALESSMRKVGYVAPMTAAADGEIIDGSARLETSAIVFDDDVLVVHHDGTKPVIMVRDDIPNAETPEAKQIALAANRIAELNLDWDAEGLLADAQAGLDMTGLFSENEIDELMLELDATQLREPESDDRGLGKEKDRTVKPVISLSDLATFESAIRLTGERNRGEAMIAICEFYLEYAERQLNLSLKGFTAKQFA